jgi:NitT/TauT family transport system substrate-binding protein
MKTREQKKDFIRRNRFLVHLFAACLVISVTVMGCDQFGAQKPKKEIMKVTLGIEASLLPAAVWVSEVNGYFEEEGLDLKIIKFDSGKASLIAMLSGDKGIDISAAAPTPIMFNSFTRQDFCVFATFAYAFEDIKVIANKDSGITNAGDLSGKKIGTLMGSTGQFFTEVFLIYNSISSDDVELVNIAPSDLPEALNGGEIDVQVIWEPHGTTAKNLLGDRYIRLPSADVYKTTFNFLTMRSFAKENPETLRRFLKTIDKATNFINKNKEEAQKITANRLNLKKENVALHWNEFTFELSLDQSFLINIEDEARWAIKNRLTDKTKVPNYLDYVYQDALKKVAPKKVTIIY